MLLLKCRGVLVVFSDFDINLPLVDFILVGRGDVFCPEAGLLIGLDDGFAGSLLFSAALVGIDRKRVEIFIFLLQTRISFRRRFKVDDLQSRVE